ncbi:hypothetical protein [Bradyrhizobium sp. 27S5]|uniref:hypothetical protein n=1 Tax=Bradyrhizobium sp. 27S5 TaxID=3139728 RepID=UPI0030CB8AC6
MTELEVMRALGIFSFIAVIFPIVKLAFGIWKNSVPRSIVFVDKDGYVVKEITAESVQKMDTKELVSLHDRIRQKHDITIGTRAAA